jgi:Cu/Zn superoxide dismutase
MSAIADFEGGRVRFAETPSGLVAHVDVCNARLADGLHGFHVHVWGDSSARCASMGAHYNPEGTTHGGISRGHAGDLGNVRAEAGCIRQEVLVPGLAMTDVIGRGLVIHAGADDLGLGGSVESSRTGSSGARLLCAPIVRAQSMHQHAE